MFIFPSSHCCPSSQCHTNKWTPWRDVPWLHLHLQLTLSGVTSPLASSRRTAAFPAVSAHTRGRPFPRACFGQVLPSTAFLLGSFRRVATSRSRAGVAFPASGVPTGRGLRRAAAVLEVRGWRREIGGRARHHPGVCPPAGGGAAG